MSTNDLPIAIDYIEAARLLTVSPRTVERLVAANTLPHFRVGRLVRIRRVDLEAYMARQVGDEDSPELNVV